MYIHIYIYYKIMYIYIYMHKWIPGAAHSTFKRPRVPCEDVATPWFPTEVVPLPSEAQ